MNAGAEVSNLIAWLAGAGLAGLWSAAVPVVAAVLSAAMIVVLRPLFVRYAMARPNGRSSHRVPTPQGGGIAVVAATVAVAAAAVALTSASGVPGFLVVLAASAALAAVGLIDDIRTLDALPRLVLQTVAVAAVIATLPETLRILPTLPWGLERALLLIAGVWFVNLVNFMDGIDWMTVAQVVPMTVGLAVAGSLGALPPDGLAVALALLGAMLGFAPFNRPVAKLFLGDVGSLPVGLLLGWLLALLAGHGHLAAAVLLPLYYLADATITLGRRIARRERITEAHRTHFYQRATDGGFSVPEIVARVFALNAVLVALALLTIWTPGRAVTLATLAAGCVLVGLVLYRFARGR